MDLADRFVENPLIRPADIRPSRPDFEVLCVLNPGVFRHEGRVGLVLRVAERPRPETGWLAVPILDEAAEGGVRVERFRLDDPQLDCRDPRIFAYGGHTFLTTLSHLRLAWSDDGRRFAIDETPTLTGHGPLETFGIDDARVACIEGRYYLTHSVGSPCGVGVGMRSTTDWRAFEHHGMIIAPDNKDVALFEERVGGVWWCLHRPSNVHIPGNHIWLAQSPDLHHWGRHHCLALARPGLWDGARVGACASPIPTDDGWLVIYHGATTDFRYCLGAMLLDRDDPRRILARLDETIMEPTAAYERRGFMPNVIFNNGHLAEGETITLYYGACDETVCGATLSREAVLAALRGA